MRPQVAVVIPCFRVRAHILRVLGEIGPEISAIYVVDDCCPEDTGSYVQSSTSDPRVRVIRHDENEGVGAAVISGYRRALDEGAQVIVKLDGDGQMSPRLIPRLVRPILEGQADYTKGNRFFSLESLKGMPALRLVGNAVLSFVNKAVSGYWNLMDPTNGFTAVHADILRMIPLAKLDRRYFFESDMLFRLNTIRAVICEVPMSASYGEEISGLRIRRVIFEFPLRYFPRIWKRIFYNYFLRDFNLCSLQLVLGSVLLLLGTGYGLYHWYLSSVTNRLASTGTVMLAAVPVILGFQLLLSAVTFDVVNVPKTPLSTRLSQ